MSDNNAIVKVKAGGVSVGAIVGCAMSIALNHSFLWAVFHLLCGWFYVFYVLLWRGQEIIPAFQSMLGLI